MAVDAEEAMGGAGMAEITFVPLGAEEALFPLLALCIAITKRAAQRQHSHEICGASIYTDLLRQS